MPPIPFRFYDFVMSGPDSPWTGTGGASLTFQPSGITDGMDSLVGHVAGLQLQVQGSIVQPALGTAIRADDWALLMSSNSGAGFIEGEGINLTARGETPVQCSFLSALRIMQHYSEYGGGMLPNQVAIGPTVPASVAGDTTPVTLQYNLNFYNERYANPFLYIKPLQWWHDGTWNFKFADPADIFGAGFAWDETPSVRLVVRLLMSPHIIMSAPFEWREKMKMATDSQTITWQPGLYDLAGYLSPAYGGDSGFCCDDLVRVLNQIFTQENKYRFPSELNPMDYGWSQNADGANTASPFALNQANYNAATDLPALATIALFGPRWTGIRKERSYTQFEAFKSIDWNANIAAGESLTNQHQFYMVRGLARGECTDTDPAGPDGLTLKSAIAEQLGPSMGGARACLQSFAPFTVWAPNGFTVPPLHRPFSTLVSFRR